MIVSTNVQDQEGEEIAEINILIKTAEKGIIQIEAFHREKMNKIVFRGNLSLI